MRFSIRWRIAAQLLGAALMVPAGSFGQEAPAAAPAPSAASEKGAIEEIVVTARQKQESLQDVPVTVAAFSEADLDRYNVQSLPEASKLVPNFQIVHGGSGNGSNLFLRGIGSSSISAAFDQSVAINIDGVVGNIGRLIHNAYLDMAQLEVLKGPQSLYFGKSATAGVVSIRTKDPGDELEFGAMGGYEFEHNQIYTELMASGPVTETLGARLAVGYTTADKLRENLSKAAENHWRGEKSFNSRLTLVWKPVDAFSARLKVNYSKYMNDGPSMNTEARCVDGVQQPSNSTFGGVFANVGEDCKFNANFAISDVTPKMAVGLPHGSDGVPFLDQATWLTSLELNWDLTSSLKLTSITGYLDLNHIDLDVYCYCNPAPGTSPSAFYNGLHRNIYRGTTQEIRLASSFDFPVNFQVGFFYQNVEQVFKAFQYAVNTSLFPLAPFLPAFFLPDGRDVVTGNGYDYNKNHYLDTTAYSGFVAGYWDITEDIQLTAGVRYTNEDKNGHIKIPYMHSFLVAIGFLPSGTRIGGLKFKDDNWSPEAAVNWKITDNISVYGAYKQGFKSGGIDNSALPNSGLNTSNPDFPDFLIYQSEKAKGGEIGLKTQFDTLRFTATGFRYTYEDLQVQQFDAAAIQFHTYNASELRTQGFETDFLWQAPVDGLTFRGAWAYTDAKYTKPFDVDPGPAVEDLNGHPRERNAKYALYLGTSYDHPLVGKWNFGLSTDLRWNSGYTLEGRLTPWQQNPFTLVDASARIYSEDNRWELGLIMRNLTDKIYAYSEGPRPGAVANAVTGSGFQDRTTTTSLGREITLQLRFHY